jgi:hypothetical protein
VGKRFERLFFIYGILLTLTFATCVVFVVWETKKEHSEVRKSYFESSGTITEVKEVVTANGRENREVKVTIDGKVYGLSYDLHEFEGIKKGQYIEFNGHKQTIEEVTVTTIRD